MLKFNRRNKRLVIPVGINPNYGIDSSTVYNTGDADIAASDVIEGKVGYGKDGKIIGTLDIQSEKEESYQEGYEFGYNEGNEAGYQLGYNEGNEAGIEIGKAEVIEGMNDATITAGTVFRGEVGYGKDGERIVGDYEFVEGFDFGVIGYSTEESNKINRSTSDDIAYSKQLMDAWAESGRSFNFYFQRNSQLVYAPYLDTSQVTTMDSAFQNCLRLREVPLYNTSNVTIMSNMFDMGGNGYVSGTPQLESVPLFDTSNVTSMYRMFFYCSTLISVPLFDTSKVTNMGQMFYNCNALTSVPAFDTSKVTNMNGMFYNCKVLISVPAFDTSKVTDMNGMFCYCDNLTSVPSFDMSKLTGLGIFSTSRFVYGCDNLTDIGGVLNYGQSFTGTGTRDLNINDADKLTKQSCLNIFNTVYDLNLNTNFTGNAVITLHATPYALLSADDIAIATSKGWTVR